MIILHNNCIFAINYLFLVYNYVLTDNESDVACDTYNYRIIYRYGDSDVTVIYDLYVVGQVFVL